AFPVVLSRPGHCPCHAASVQSLFADSHCPDATSWLIRLCDRSCLLNVKTSLSLIELPSVISRTMRTETKRCDYATSRAQAQDSFCLEDDLFSQCSSAPNFCAT